jgi:hypothetical protein
MKYLEHTPETNNDLEEGIIDGTYTVDVLSHTGSVAPASDRFIEINAPGKFVYTRRYDWDFPGLGRRETKISYIIDGNGQGTRLRVIHEGFKSQEEAALQHSAGWIRVINWLGDYLEAQEMNDYRTSIETDRAEK